MKRLGLVLAGLALAGAVNTADAQLTMQMGNGWSATFAGNVNAFWIYTDNQTRLDTDGGPSLDPNDSFETTSKTNGIGTGLLPAFFTFEAKGKEGNTDLGVHFGFAPQVSAGRNVASSFGTDAAGAQIDMRQVYLTVGGAWGQILAGKELGLFERQAILTDMTLFGAGVNTGFRGTALGRIGYGYLYTDFRAQFTYSSPAGKVAQLSFGVFEPTTTGYDNFNYSYGDMPRFEAEITVKPKFKNDKNTLLLWVDGLYGHVKCAAVDADCFSGDANDPNPGISETGLALGGKFDISGFSVMASGFLASGLGSLFQGNAYVGGGFTGDGTDAFGNAKSSQGFIVQAMYTIPNGKVSLGASYGQNKLNLTDDEKNIPAARSASSPAVPPGSASSPTTGRSRSAWWLSTRTSTRSSTATPSAATRRPRRSPRATSSPLA
jgi:hypothetical protein